MGKAPGISQEIKYELLVLFRILQCCRTPEDWPSHRNTFLKNVETLVMSQGLSAMQSYSSSGADSDFEPPSKSLAKSGTSAHAYHRTQFNFIQEYFNCNWFVDEWIREPFRCSDLLLLLNC